MKKIFLFTLTLGALLIGYHAGAQPLNRSTPEKLLKSAQEAEATGNPYEALELYKKIYDETKDKNAAVRIAMLNYELRDYVEAERRLGRLVTRDRKKEYVELMYFYAQALKHNGKYPEAIEMFQTYASVGQDPALVAACKNEIAGAELARKAKQPENLLVNNAGKKVNTPQTEASPAYSGGELYYTSLNAKDVIVIDGKEGDWYAKIYTASKANPTEFGDPSPLGTQINREGWHQGNVSITPDGRTMYFTRIELESNTLKTSRIFYAVKGADGWGAANEVTGVNGEYIAKHPCEGELFGEKVLFFVANMPGGKGGDDIYYAPKKTDGVFGLPVNLGEAINTPRDEATPFYRDGKLYFSSNGLPTFGGHDVFESQWNGSVWSTPKNMPMGINTSLDDLFYTQDADGMTGYLVSNRPGPNNLKSKTCCDDIYAWEIERIKVNLTARTFTFKKKNEKENPPLPGATVQLVDVSNPDPLQVDTKTNAAGNDFGFSLQPEKSYLAIATREGYVPDTVKLNTVGVKKTQNIERKFTLRAIRKEPDSIIVKINEPIRLNSIYYDFNDDKILADAEKDLQFLVDLMNRYPDLKIELSSHTDARGGDEYNEALSQRRADSAKRWIVAKGIATDRIVAKGYGETQLLNECKNGVECNEDQHRLNRRTEFKIIAGPTSITIERKERRPATAPGGRN